MKGIVLRRADCVGGFAHLTLASHIPLLRATQAVVLSVFGHTHPKSLFTFGLLGRGRP